MLRLIRWVASKLQRREIRAENGALYLERFKLFGWMPGSTKRYPFSIYLHRFHLHDLDPAPHSHPWKWSFSIVLSGSYDELHECTCPLIDHFVPRRIRWFNWIGSRFHRISALHGEVWTLFVVGPKASSWGFLVDGRVVPWRDRLRQRGNNPDY